MKGWLRPAIAEGIGTFGLIFMGAGSIIVNHATNGALGVTGIALAHGLAIALGIAAVGRFSGGHFNPAVTISMLVTKRITMGLGLIYIGAQLLSALIGGMALVALYPAADSAATRLGVPMISPDISFQQAVLIEGILTFFLVTLIYATAVDPKGPGHLAPFAIGLTITMDVLAGGPLTGAAMNPARWFGAALAAQHWANSAVYLLGPILGGGLAGLVYSRFVAARPSA